MSGYWLGSYVALWAVVALLAFVVMGLLRQFGLLQMRVGIEPGVLITGEGIERGAEAPRFEARDLVTGRMFRSTDLLGCRMVLVFLTPTCGECRTVANQLSDVAEQWREVQFLSICFGSDHACEEMAVQARLRVPLLADAANTIASSYRVSSTPFAYLVDEDGKVLIRGIVNTWAQLEALLQERGTLRTGVSIEEVIGGDSVLVGTGARGPHGNGLNTEGGDTASPELLSAATGDGHGEHG